MACPPAGGLEPTTPQPESHKFLHLKQWVVSWISTKVHNFQFATLWGLRLLWHVHIHNLGNKKINCFHQTTTR